MSPFEKTIQKIGQINDQLVFISFSEQKTMLLNSLTFNKKLPNII